MLNRVAGLSVILAALTASAVAAATPPKVQIQVDGLGLAPSGNVSAAGNASTSDLFGAGLGASVAMIYRPAAAYGLGVRASWSRNAKDGTLRFYDPSGLPSGTYNAHRSLFSIPIEGFAEYHLPIGGAAALRAEAGVGVTSSTERITLSDASGGLFAIAGYQKSFSYGLGLSLATFWIPGIELQTGAAYRQAVTEDGDVWSQGDDPALLAGTVGIRFPRR